ncbi:phospholipase A2 inhibitor 31 kDa subunit-like isoform X1 [Rana temporaria]|uniref:phospholipase A2 inhibitor 31 kDa subunit-like isoform X1 n=1 Tax=Rana temporaria TaxID=8407 RepID=UPI001AAD9256|nr:phospholipase A2 inhibitor 31 kDa subunit-like isoform X1 [Rana temporaria]XP_040183318.1 phospholipase A2 inhibitor 31 kDa subunit-like isoform X1 [Rana temporaria]
MNTIFVFLILSGMVTTGYLTTVCNRCWSLDSTACCTEKEVQCDGSQCTMLSEYFNISNVIYNSVKKTCAIESMCNGCFSVSTNRDFFLRVSGECGYGDYSNADMEYTELCHDLLSPNGYKCPSCYIKGSTKGCTSNEMVLCRGKELECLDYRGVFQLSSSDVIATSVKACITKGGCELGFKASLGAKEINGVMMKCTPAIPVHSAGDQ